MKRKWIQQCGLTELPGKAPRICSEHFNKNDFGTGGIGKKLSTLDINAFPVLGLGMVSNSKSKLIKPN